MTPWLQDADVMLYHGDVLAVLREFPAESVDCCVTSPPYWGLRDYGTGAWEGGDAGCDHKQRDARGDSGRVSTDDRPGNINPAPVDTPIQYAQFCRKCGATRIDQQLGLEPTPEEYVARMVEVFREVRRVLAAHGTVWLNLGDSYASTAPGTVVDAAKMTGKHVNSDAYRRAETPSGLKPKDLVGIPWAVAKALQAPYYTGKIKDERERIWLAATVEAEGCLFIHKRGVGQYASSFTKADGTESHYHRKNATYGAGLEVASTDRIIVERCMEITDLGSISEQTPDQNARRKQTIYRWNLRSNVCREVIRELYPHFLAKRHEARLLLGCPSSGEKAERAHESLKALHQGGTPDIDFAAPESMFEGGWYLRSDIIWSKKPNPMPESVTDRPTKSHEYLFLLSKQPRYYFDAEAVREKAEWARWGDQTVQKYNGTDTAAGWIQPKSKEELQRRNPTWEERKAAGATRGNLAFGENVGAGTQRGVHGEGVSHDLGDPVRGRNIRSVWEIATQPYPEAHFATFPEELARRCIAAGTSERGKCPECGAPWVRLLETERSPGHMSDSGYNDASSALRGSRPGNYGSGGQTSVKQIGWTPSCGRDCKRHGTKREAAEAVTVPMVVLDPFIGSGTVAHVARKLGRHAVGIDLNESYLKLAARRLQQQSLFASEVVA